jgi:hypothetical protein
MKCRRGKHLIEPHGFCHRIQHAPKAGLQFLSVGTVHHSYHVVIFSGNYRFNPRDWSQSQARQHHVLFVSASSGKDRYSIYILRPIHKRKSECSGTIGELRAGPWG